MRNHDCFILIERFLILNFRTVDILGATELTGPINYRYKDLKSATKNFSKENKLGEGGFGDVYKVNYLCVYCVQSFSITTIHIISLETLLRGGFFLLIQYTLVNIMFVC